MATGFFGKLPARGDFVTRGLPPGARPMVDRWLTRMLAPLARQPEDWPAGGFRALLGHGDEALALLILPSRDTSGREFPLAAVSPATAAGQAEIDHWADQALTALDRACRGDLDADDLAAVLDPLAVAAGQTALTPPLIWAVGQPPTEPVAVSSG
ncbi:type VI secretion system-associated protein TagF [Paracoccus zhejiangensis]|uniref:Type VI secretion system-associated protein TagF n=1 Tax=Paracoccus zhejiangensis TaxID=1077935 RepID=A0A2H5F4R8_9RHOB|nr:type VI secretion system-associated protein TagF [Paracoccus zhejiangensis]AUH66535.1 type VI secretion system-associated protein TagF [Paracoccus zhejiangensis]